MLRFGPESLAVQELERRLQEKLKPAVPSGAAGLRDKFFPPIREFLQSKDVLERGRPDGSSTPAFRMYLSDYFAFQRDRRGVR